MQQSVLVTRRLIPLSHLDILFVISIDDMRITQLNKYIKNTLK